MTTIARRRALWLAAMLLALAVGPLAAQRTPVQKPTQSGVQKSAPATAAAEVGILARINETADQLKLLKADLQALQAQLAQAQQHLQGLMAAKPVPPGAGAKAEALAAYQEALAKWQGAVDAKQQQITALQAQIAAKQQQIDAKQQELAKLQQLLRDPR